MKYLLLIMMLSACATPITVLSNGKENAMCGGGTVGTWAGGLIGYHIQKSYDEQCVEEYKANGYNPIQVKASR